MESEDTSCMEVEDAEEKEDKLKTSMEQLLSLNTEKDETIQKLENDIGSKRVEVEQANEKLEELQTSMEELQSSSREKDELIEILQRQAEKLDPILADMDQLLELHKADEKTILKLEDDIGSKCIEVEQANEKLEKLRTSMEQIQSSIRRKDETIVLLNGQVEQANDKLEKLQSSMEQLQSSIGGKYETIVILKGEVEQTNMKLDKLVTSMQHLESSIRGKDETIVILKGEAEQANMKLEKLVTSMQHLESSNTRKDEIIGKLKADLAKFEEETSKSKKEPSKLSEKVEIMRKSEGVSLMPVLNSYSGPLTRSMARQKRSTEIPTTSHALEGVSITPAMISCTTKPCTQVRRSTRSQVRRPVSKTESLGSQVFDIEKTEMKKSITRKRKPDEDNSILGQKPRTRKKQCSS